MQENIKFPVHHVSPQELAGHSTLRLLGDRFNLDRIGNLMALPPKQGPAQEIGSSPHTGGHLGTYSKNFCKFLTGLQAHPSFVAAQAGDPAALDRLTAEVSRFVAVAKFALANEHLLANTPAGMTPEEANKRNEDWFGNWETYAKRHWDSIQQMRDTVDQLYDAGQRDGALYWPILSPNSSVSLADKNAILERYGFKSPISQHFTVVGPVPNLPGLVPPMVDTRLPGFIPPMLEGLDQPEGFTPSDPLLKYGLPGFPVPRPDWRQLVQLPPSTAMPPDRQVLQFHPETGQPLRRISDGSPVLGPPPAPDDQGDALLMAAAVLGAGALMTPGAQGLAAALLAGATAAAAIRPAFAANTSSDTKVADGSVFSKGAAPYNPFDPERSARSSGDGRGDSSGISPRPPLIESGTLGPETNRASTFADRFGNWTETPAGAVPAPPMSAPEATAPAAATVAPEDVRRLTRVNASNAGSVFSSGSSPVPYLPSPEFNDRFGNWSMPTGEGGPQQTSRPVGAFADEPSYIIPPPIWGLEGSGSPRNDAEEWFSRWIQPLLRE